MDIGELIAYVSPLIPIAASIVNDWKDWRKKHTKRSNVVLMILAIVFAWAMIWYDNQGHRKQAHEQAQALSELEAQNRTLITRNQDLQAGMNTLHDQNQDLQNDLNALRVRFKVKSSRTRPVSEVFTTSDSVKADVKRVSP